VRACVRACVGSWVHYLQINLYGAMDMNESVYCYGQLCLSVCRPILYAAYVCEVSESRPDGSQQEPDFVHRNTSLI
jgi:hypothetical protein